MKCKSTIVKETEYKKWLFKFFGIIIGLMICIGLINVILDPYFHFHKPIINYRLYEQRYINDGITRHFEYDALITGNSLSENFTPSHYDELFGTNSIKIPYSGGGYKELWSSVGRAIRYNKKLNQALVTMDIDDLARSKDWQRYNDVPEYLYDNNVFNDVEYVLNKTVTYRGSLFNILWTLSGNESTSMDEYSTWERETGYIPACASLPHVEDQYELRLISAEDYEKIAINLESNVFPVISNNPDITFKLVIPPSSVAKWAEYYCKGEVDWKIDSVEFAIPLLLQFENVELYGFDDEYAVTDNLEKYSDTVHYDKTINAWMLEQIKTNQHRITVDNYSEYINGIRAFYSNYDYTTLNEYIDK